MGEVGAEDGRGEGEVEDKPGKAGVGDDEVGAAAEGEEREMVGAGEGDGFEEILVGVDGGEEAGGATDFEGGVGGQRDVFLKFHLSSLPVREKRCGRRMKAEKGGS